MEPSIRQQFGFLFTYRGRTAFLFMYAPLSVCGVTRVPIRSLLMRCLL